MNNNWKLNLFKEVVDESLLPPTDLSDAISIIFDHITALQKDVILYKFRNKLSESEVFDRIVKKYPHLSYDLGYIRTKFDGMYNDTLAAIRNNDYLYNIIRYGRINLIRKINDCPYDYDAKFLELVGFRLYITCERGDINIGEFIEYSGVDDISILNNIDIDLLSKINRQLLTAYGMFISHIKNINIQNNESYPINLFRDIFEKIIIDPSCDINDAIKYIVEFGIISKFEYQIITMYYKDNKTISEIANFYKKTDGDINKSLNNALKSIRYDDLAYIYFIFGKDAVYKTVLEDSRRKEIRILTEKVQRKICRYTRCYDYSNIIGLSENALMSILNDRKTINDIKSKLNLIGLKLREPGSSVDNITKWPFNVFYTFININSNTNPPEDLEDAIKIIIEEYLDDIQKDVFVKYFKEGMNLSEIAKKIGISGERVRQRLCKIYRMLNPRYSSDVRPYDLLKYGIYRANLNEVHRHSTEGAYEITIEQVGFSIRTYNCLKRSSKIEKLSDLEKYTKDDLLKFRNLGVKSISEIELKMHEYGLSLAQSE